MISYLNKYHVLTGLLLCGAFFLPHNPTYAMEERDESSSKSPSGMNHPQKTWGMDDREEADIPPSTLSLSSHQANNSPPDFLEKKAEQQKTKKHEPEQREIEEKVIIWSSGIDTTIQHIKDLENYNLTYGELLKVLETIDKFYTKETQKAREPHDAHSSHLRTCQTCQHDTLTGKTTEILGNLIQRIQLLAEGSIINTMGVRKNNNMRMAISKEIKKNVEKKMEEYRLLQGTNHPRWNEFGGKQENQKEGECSVQ